jgi:hypothetical protein
MAHGADSTAMGGVMTPGGGTLKTAKKLMKTSKCVFGEGAKKIDPLTKSSATYKSRPTHETAGIKAAWITRRRLTNRDL